jgi:hypothetical protein
MGRIGLLLAVVGGVLGFIGYQEYQVSVGASEEPEEIALADLVARGPDGNPHVKIKDFVCGLNLVYEEKGGKWQSVYIPTFPAEGGIVPKLQLPPSGPVPLIIKSSKAKNQDQADELTRESSIQGMVVNKIQSLGSKEKQLLIEHYPGTDFDKCLILQHDRTPGSKVKVGGFLGGGVLLLGLGVVLLVASYKKTGSIW